MLKLNQETKAIKELLSALDEKLDNLNSDNFDEEFQSSLELMMIIRKMVDELSCKLGIENLVNYDPEIFIRAKQIEKKYDNIIEKFRFEANELERELLNLNNKKRILNYIR